jgi:cytochrome c oxidase accessory protein FixG
VTTTRLDTVDAQGRRLWVYPADARGPWRVRRTVVTAALVAFFLALPWLRIGGRPALLLDVFHGRFSVLGLAFFAADAPMLFFLAAGAVVTLAFVTSVWGRAWCGWACPQTVFVDLIFRRIERMIEGDGVRRRRLDQGPWTADKAMRKSLKWAAYAAVALALSHSFLAVFIGTEALGRMMAASPGDNPGSFALMALITGAVLFDFGWFREQFCTLVCPYGRFQSVLMDERSLTVAYDASRAPDCVDCRRCVQVCPTGIDIRRGLQLECVACTACIDACDTVMRKVKKPEGLIRYRWGWRGGSWLKGRPVAYLVILALLAAGLATALVSRQPVEIALVRAVGEPYREISREGAEPEIVNHFHLDARNRTGERLVLDVGTAAGVRMVLAGGAVSLAPGESRRFDLFATFPRRALRTGRLPAQIALRAQGAEDPFVISQEVTLVGPLR